VAEAAEAAAPVLVAEVADQHSEYWLTEHPALLLIVLLQVALKD